MVDVHETCYTELSLGFGSFGMDRKFHTDTKSETRGGGSINIKNKTKDDKSTSFVLSLGFPLNTICSEKSEGGNMDRPTTDHHSPDSNSNSDSENSGHRRKKLRLTKEQSAMLEESFKLQTTLIPSQKQLLADKLNLKPRQVEVWFQNRRARSKLKQTEEDYEVLKRYCEGMIDENRRLKKLLEDLKSSQKFEQSHLYHHSELGSPMFIRCSSCERKIGRDERKRY